MATSQELILKLNDVISGDVQAAFKCGICMSTMKDPWLTTCNHPFCKDCLLACFGRTTRIECPMCRQSIQKRGCGASQQIANLVEAYLGMAGAFKSEINKYIPVIPPERRFLESQAVTPSLKRFAVPHPKKRARIEELPPIATKRAREEENEEKKKEEEPQFSHKPDDQPENDGKRRRKRNQFSSTPANLGSQKRKTTAEDDVPRRSYGRRATPTEVAVAFPPHNEQKTPKDVEEEEEAKEDERRRRSSGEGRSRSIHPTILETTAIKSLGVEEEKNEEKANKDERRRRSSGQGRSRNVHPIAEEKTPRAVHREDDQRRKREERRLRRSGEGDESRAVNTEEKTPRSVHRVNDQTRKKDDRPLRRSGEGESSAVIPEEKTPSDAVGGEEKTALLEEERKGQKSKELHATGQGGSWPIQSTAEEKTLKPPDANDEKKKEATPRKFAIQNFILPRRNCFSEEKIPEIKNNTPDQRWERIRRLRGRTTVVVDEEHPLKQKRDESKTPRRRLFQSDEGCTPGKSTLGFQTEPKEKIPEVVKVDVATQSKFPVITKEDLLRVIEKKKESFPAYSTIDALFTSIPGLKDILIDNMSDLKVVLPALMSLWPDEKIAADDIVLDSMPARSVETRKADDSVMEVAAEEENKENTTVELSDDEVMEEDEANITIQGEEDPRLNQSFNEPVFKRPNSFVLPSEEVEKMVIAISRLESLEDQTLVQKFSSAFPRVTIIAEVEDGCTHLVMMNTDCQNNCPTRSLRFVFAVARGCEIVGRKWLAQCVAQNKILQTDNFAVRIDKNKERGNFKHLAGPMPWKEARQRPKLFAGKKFYLPKIFCESKAVPREKVVELIQLCGGELVSKIWEITPKECAIIFGPCSKDVADALRYEHDTKAPVYTVDFILDSIANYEVPYSTIRYRVTRQRRQ